MQIKDPAPLPEDEAVRQDNRLAVRAALIELTTEQQEVIVMKFSLGYDNARVAAIHRDCEQIIRERRSNLTCIVAREDLTIPL